LIRMESDAMEIENSRADRANTEIDHFERLLVVCRGRTTPYLVYVTKSKLWSPLGGGVPKVLANLEPSTHGPKSRQAIVSLQPK
jgi:hypothetical protein